MTIKTVQPEQHGNIRLRILATTDVHGQLLGWDYARDTPLPDIGLARLATDIDRLRAQGIATLVFDNGDFLQGSPLCDLATARLESDPRAPHPVIAAMNAIGYDAATIGNHEFNFGLGALNAALGQVSFPVVSTNITGLGPRVAPHLLVGREVDGQRLRIGVIGLAPARMGEWGDDLAAAGIGVTGLVEAGRRAAERLRSQGADLIVALCHAGLAALPDQETAADIAGAGFAEVVVAGHTHEIAPPSPRESGALPATVSAGAYGSHLAVVDLTLGRDGAGRWRVLRHRTEARPCGPLPRPAIARALAPAHEAARLELARPVGATPVPLDSHFALCGYSGAMALVAEAMLDAARPLAEKAGMPLLAAVSPFRTGRAGVQDFVELAAGPVLQRDLAAFCPFPDHLRLLEISGAGVRRWLDHAGALFRTVKPGAVDAALIDPAFAPYNFDVIAGLCYQFDLARPQGGPRVGVIRHGAVTVGESDRFLMVVTSYKAAGGGGYPVSMTRPVNGNLPALSEAVAHRLAKGRAPALSVIDWGFAPLADTSVVIDSAPHAARVHNGPSPAGAGERGLTRFRLDLGRTLARTG